MKAIILNFKPFTSKKNKKNYYFFDVYDLESKKLYPCLISSQEYCPIPGGAIPTDKEIKEDFPRVADIAFTVDSFRDPNTNETKYRPVLKAVNSWQKLVIK